jgi:anti-sigma regulatory factor (Ser/Thr protein kinase)
MVEVISSRAELDPMEVNRMVLAVDELFANISEHGYGDKPGIIEMRAEMRPSELCFEFRDFAPPILDKAELKGRDLDEIRPGGLGLHLIRSVMDETYHRPLSDGNHWVLIRYLSAKERNIA